ncbi:MAG: sigma-70 family RNA polymerase sigma factor [Terriglobales bacterium]
MLSLIRMHAFPVQVMASGILAGWASLHEGEQIESDADLMRRVATGDSRAFEQIYDRHSRAVFSLLLRIIRERERAEDLMQEVFLTLWRQAARYDDAAASALPWLLVVARNRALDRLRSPAHRREQVESEEGLELAAAASGFALPPSFDARAWERQALERIRTVLPRLTPDERHVIEMAYFDGFTQAEISAQTGTPLGTVKTWTRSGLAKLRTALQ